MKAVGDRGERWVARWLRWRGYRILARQMRAAGGEIDLIALRLGTVHIVEVKTLRRIRRRRPSEAVDHAKRRRLARAAAAWLATYTRPVRRVEFTVAEVELRRLWPRVRYLRDAFRPDDGRA